MQQPEAAGTRASAWTLSDGRAGNVRQAAALARALALPEPRAMVLEAHAPWRWLAPRLLPGARHAFGSDFRLGMRQPPALAIGCGRQAALATRLLRAHGTQTVQILDPRIDPQHWDLVIVPEHDALTGDNVITLIGSLHPVDDAWLAQARERFAAFAALPQPRTAVLLGGPGRHADIDAPSLAAQLSQLRSRVQDEGGSVLLTTSRRTPPAWQALVERHLAAAPGVRWFGAAGAGTTQGENPYPGLLAWADRIVCTPDSVNMVSEACATRAPVFVFEPSRVDGRPRRFLDALIERGRVRAADATLAPFVVEPLRETARVAMQVRERLGLREAANPP